MVNSEGVGDEQGLEVRDVRDARGRHNASSSQPTHAHTTRPRGHRNTRHIVHHASFSSRLACLVVLPCVSYVVCVRGCGSRLLRRTAAVSAQPRTAPPF